ncbi:MAG: SDR family oxidoreductase [Lautropia sp.]|nr:SDR family oxidoreductase [Lautropia sp.]
MTGSNSTSRVAIVTGAGSGLGREMALRFARDGAAVVVADQNGETASAVSAEIGKAKGRALGIRVDVRSQGEVEAMVRAAVENFGGLHILVNSAGVGEQTAFLKQTIEGFERIIAVNLTGTYRCVHVAAPEMIKCGWGRIINISSVTGLRGVSGRVSYGASKTGIVGMTRALAIELAPYNITVNAIAPGPVDTEMVRQVHSQATRETYNRNSPMHRYGTTVEIADGAAFLASDQASYITGHTLPIDGGMTATAAIFDLDT